MRKSRCLGLIGGLGVGATVYYYERLARGCEDRGVTLDVVITNAYTPRVFEYVAAHDRVGLADYLNAFIHRMKAAGAEVAAVPAVTPHYAIQELAATSPLPIVSIFDALREEFRTPASPRLREEWGVSGAIRRVAIFGTRFVIESDFFGALPGVEIVRPKAHEIDLIHKTYVDLAAAGKGSPHAYDKLTALAKTLVDRDRLDAIVLAGTDLTLLFDESNAEFPCVDCARVHVAQILERLAGSQ